MSKKTIVMPGEDLSNTKELSPGEGTFESNGTIKASRIGMYHVDEKTKKAHVKPITSIPVTLKKGDIVIAEVTNTKPSMVIVDVQHVTGKNRAISGDTNGTIHASEISQSYTKDASTEYKIGDIVRAKVFQVKPSIQLTTKDRNLGAIKALCSRCRHPLIKKNKNLECSNCGNKEHRRITDDYGDIDLKLL
ncbi:MAG: exosome complex RNA-binding protein Csl4 [Candidatus Thermoplasmatota archaeon]